jgi:nucleoside-diphosphate-sugar epimerase
VSAEVRSADPDWVFQLAAHGAYSWQRHLERRVNLVATVRLLALRAERGCAAVVHVGSSSEYGCQYHGPGDDGLVGPTATTRR